MNMYLKIKRGSCFSLPWNSSPLGYELCYDRICLMNMDMIMFLEACTKVSVSTDGYLLKKLKKNGIEEVRLAPFMFVAGEHAKMIWL